MQSVTDTKELIPEFFYLPEFLENREGQACRLYIPVFRCVVQDVLYEYHWLAVGMMSEL